VAIDQELEIVGDKNIVRRKKKRKKGETKAMSFVSE